VRAAHLLGCQRHLLNWPAVTVQTPLGVPAAFLSDDVLPHHYEGLNGPTAIRQRRASAAHGICGPPPIGECRGDRAATEQPPPRKQRPEEPEQPQIRATGYLGKKHTQQDRNTVDSGRQRASLQEYSVGTLLYLRTCLVSLSPLQFTGN